MNLRGWKFIIMARRQIIAVVITLLAGSVYATANPAAWEAIKPNIELILGAIFTIVAVVTGVNDADAVQLGNRVKEEKK